MLQIWCCKEAWNSKTWILLSHLQPNSTEALYIPHSFKLSVTNSVSSQMRNMATISPSVPELWRWIMTIKKYLALWCHIEFDLWPFGWKMSSLHHCILLDYLCEMLSWLAYSFLSDGQKPLKISSIPPWVQVDVWRDGPSILEISRTREWDGQPNIVMPLWPLLSVIKSIQCSVSLHSFTAVS